MVVRPPCVAGSFYPSEARQIRDFCQSHFIPKSKATLPKAIILPHAGYIYSGKTACKVLSEVEIPKKNLLIGPNHQGIGSDFAIFPQGSWQTPLGLTALDSHLAEALLKSSPEIEPDEEAHAFEHSLEVLVPLLQFRNPDFEMTPMIVGTLDLERAGEVARACGEVLSNVKEPVLAVISNDMSHYESEEATRKKDRYALEAIENLDAEALARAVQKYRITMCGFAPVYMLLKMAAALQIKKAKLIEYTTSAEASGDRSRVVGYAGFIFE